MKTRATRIAPSPRSARRARAGAIAPSPRSARRARAGATAFAMILAASGAHLAGCVGQISDHVCNKARRHVASCLPNAAFELRSECEGGERELSDQILGATCAQLVQEMSSPGSSGKFTIFGPTVMIVGGLAVVDFLLMDRRLEAVHKSSPSSASSTGTSICSRAIEHVASCIPNGIPTRSGPCAPPRRDSSRG